VSEYAELKERLAATPLSEGSGEETDLGEQAAAAIDALERGLCEARQARDDASATARQSALREAAEIEFARVLAGHAYDTGMSRDPEWLKRYYEAHGIFSRSDYIAERWHLYVSAEKECRDAILAALQEDKSHE
jgi:hypothetical protein